MARKETGDTERAVEDGRNLTVTTPEDGHAMKVAAVRQLPEGAYERALKVARAQARAQR